MIGLRYKTIDTCPSVTVNADSFLLYCNITVPISSIPIYLCQLQFKVPVSHTPSARPLNQEKTMQYPAKKHLD
jgi:hypothetical protein